MKIVTVKIEDLVTNVVQPPGRTTAKKLATLKASLQRRGLLKPVLVAQVKGKLILVDGHRTCVAWEELGNPNIAAIVVEANSVEEAQALFAEINEPTLKQVGKDFLYQWSVATDRDSQLQAMGRRASNVRRFVELFGPETAAKYGRRGDVDPNIVNVVSLICRVASLYTEAPKPSQAGHWVIKHSASVTARYICTMGTPAQIKQLVRLIQSGKPPNFKQTHTKRRGARKA